MKEKVIYIKAKWKIFKDMEIIYKNKLTKLYNAYINGDLCKKDYNNLVKKLDCEYSKVKADQRRK